MAAGREEGYYSGLYEIAAAINLAGTPGAVLRSLVENVTRAMEAKGCSLMLLTPDRKLLLHMAACGLSRRYIRKGPVSIDKSISEALEGRPVAVLDAAEDKRVQFGKEAREEGIASMLSVPVMRRGEVVGVIRVYTAEERQFTKADVYFLGAVANVGAIALENARFLIASRRA